MNKIFKILILLIITLLPSSANARVEPFNKHYIVVVDQTISTNNANLGIIYRSLRNWLNGNSPDELDLERSTIPTPIHFDEQHDELSLFAFGLTGVNGTKGSFADIHNKCYKADNQNKCINYSFERHYMDKKKNAGEKENEKRETREQHQREEIVDEISQKLIHPRGKYTNCEKKFEDFLSDDVRSLFNGTDDLHMQISNLNGITMSHFVYPLIMEYISKKETASEYYLIIVSDFKSGLYSNNDADDWVRFNELTAGNSKIRSIFERKLNSMRAPFVQSDYLHFQAGNVGARGTRIFLKSVVQKSQVYLSSSLVLKQLKGNNFELNEAKIAFDKDKQTTIDSIQVVVSDSGRVLCRQNIASGDEEIAQCFDENQHNFAIRGQNLKLSHLPCDNVSVTYILYTMSHNEAGEAVLPIALMASQDIAYDDIIMINQKQRDIMIKITFTLAIILVLIIALMLGRQKKLHVEIGRFAQKYMNITKEHGAIELPCWFCKNGVNKQSLRVNGNIMYRWKFSIGVTKKIYVRLQDACPQGIAYYVDGQNADNFVEVKLHGKAFAFNIDIELNPNVIDVSRLNECSVVPDFKIVSSIFGLLRHEDYAQASQHVNFYLVHDLGTAWVGFDPGTSGSCVSVGCPSGTPGQPSIQLIKNGIIPSKLVLKSSCVNKSIDSYIPGVDYIYGNEADQQWEAHIKDGRPCFQSIKKLLGYKNADGDKICVTYHGGQIEYTGLDLASLLVRGLQKDMREEINAMSQSKRELYVGKNAAQSEDSSSLLKRAVVAIPNNYTLPKIIEMVESVRRLEQFEEVRYVYEAEAILFNHFQKDFANNHPSVENIMVYDMGGATINISVFKVEYIQSEGTTYYYVHTLGRIGYGVGGDNIDVAIMEYLFTLNEVVSSLKNNDSKRYDFEKENKLKILRDVLRMKLNVITAFRKPSDSTLDILGAEATLKDYLDNLFKGYGTIRPDAFSTATNLAQEMTKKMLESDYLSRYVYNYIEDAVKEIVNYPDVKQLNGIDKVIFAGRSTLFPYVYDHVLDNIKKYFPNSNSELICSRNPLDVKSAVAVGACWYGIYSNLVTLDNSRSFGTYGFKLTMSGQSHLETLLPQNTRFDENGRIKGEKAVESNFHADGNVVEFYQVMGNGDGDNVFAPGNRHKVNSIGYINVPIKTSEISMTVNLQNKVHCEVIFETGNSDSVEEKIEGRDITKENDLAYTFAVDNDDRELSFTDDTEKPKQHIARQGKSAPKSAQPSSFIGTSNTPYVPRKTDRL